MSDSAVHKASDAPDDEFDRMVREAVEGSGSVRAEGKTASNSSKPLLAYKVTEEDEGTGGIVFAKTNAQARRLGASQFGDGEFAYYRAVREQWADAYLGKPVPASEMVAHGWWFECCGCGLKLDEYLPDEHGKPFEGIVGTQDSLTFCCQDCADAFEAERAEIKKVEAEAVETLKHLVHRRFPGVEFVSGFGKEHAYACKTGGEIVIEQAFVSFRFPGQKYGPASFRLDIPYRRFGPFQPHYSCCHGDLEAFRAFAEAAPPALSEEKA